MVHNQVSSDFGPGNTVCAKLREASRLANIADDRYAGLAPETLLCRWSDIVKRDFISANLDIARVTEDGSRAVAYMNQRTDMLRMMMGKWIP